MPRIDSENYKQVYKGILPGSAQPRSGHVIKHPMMILGELTGEEADT